MACKPDEQNRLMVVPATEVGSPASIAAIRAMLWPCGPCGCAQPSATSSISLGSSFGVLCNTSLMQCAASSSGRAILNEPRKDLVSAVRELATTTASLISTPLLRSRTLVLAEVGEGFPFFGQTLQQWCGLPEFAVLLMEFPDAIVDLLQTGCVGVPHRSAAMRREPVAIHVDDVNVDGAQGVALLQDARTLIDQPINAAIHDLLRGDLPLLDTGFGGPLAHQFGHFGIGNRAALGVVLIPAGAGFLAVAPHFAEAILGERLAHAGLFEVAVFFADAPAHVEPREVTGRERPHGHAVVV